MNKLEFSNVLGWNPKAVYARLNALNLLAVCGRCLGSGSYSFCPSHGTMCFGCSGSGKKIPRLTAKLVKTVQAKVAAGELVPYLAAVKARSEAVKAIAPLFEEAKALYAPFGAAYEVEYLAKYGKDGDRDMEMNSVISNAQSFANAAFYGTNVSGEGSSMGATCIERNVKAGRLDPVKAVAMMTEVVEALRSGLETFRAMGF
jgi:hypothetical protein